MKFLFELVPCFVPQPYDTSATDAQQPKGEEMRTLTRPSRRRKRVRVVGLPGNSADWKPSLSSISENKAVMEKPSEDSKPTGERQVRRKGGSGGGGSKSRTHVRSPSDGFGLDSYETVIPAFAPTPFIL